MQPKQQMNLAACATMFLFAFSTMTLPISLINITRELGLNLTQAGSLGFISSWTQLIILTVSGFIAARLGKIRSLKVALIVTALGLALFAKAGTYSLALSIIVIMGLGYGVIEGLITPLVEDLYPQDDGRRQNLLHAFWPLGVLASTLVVGELLSRGISWRWIYLVQALLTGLISLLYPSPRRIKLPASRADFSHVKEILSQPRLWMLGGAIFFGGGAEGAISFWAASYIQLHYSVLPRAGAWGTAAFAFGMGLGRLLVGSLAGKVGLQSILWYSALLAAVAGGGLFLIEDLKFLYPFLGFMGLTAACHWPSLQTFAVRGSSSDPTLVMIFMSTMGIPGFSSAAILMGIIGDRAGLRKSFLIMPFYFVLLLLMLTLTRIWDRKTAKAEGKKAP